MNIASALARKWAAEPNRPHAVEGTSMRHSMAGGCSRAIHYYVTGTESSNPPDLAGHHSMGIGSLVHAAWQAAVIEELGADCVEAEVPCAIPEADSSGNADLVLHSDKQGLVVTELKSINGFGFKKLAEDGQAPRFKDFVQLCMNAYALNADVAMLVYLSLESISRPRALKKDLVEHERFSKQYFWKKEEFTRVAQLEIERWAEIRKAGDKTERLINDPEYVVGAKVIDPEVGRLADPSGKIVGHAWQCGYCPWQDKCAEDNKA